MSTQRKALSRRELLKVASVGTAAMWLAACAESAPDAPSQAEGSSPAQETMELTISTDWNVDARKEFMDQITANFQEENPDVSVEVWNMGGGGTSGPGAMSDIVVAQMLTDTVADVVMGWGLMLFERQEYLADLTDQVEELNFNIDDYYYATEACFTPDDRLYGIPWGHSVSGWVYNRTMFQEAGVDEPTDDWTWADMLEAAHELTKPDQQQHGVEAVMAHAASAHEHMWAAGGTYRTQDGTRTNMNTEGSIAAFERYIALMFEERVAPDPAEAATIAGTTNPFAQGRVAMRPQLLHSVGEMARDIGDRFEWGCMPTPKDPSTGMAANRELTEPWFVTRVTLDRGHFEQAANLATYLVSDVGEELLLQTGAFIPGKKGWLEDPTFLEPMPYNKEQIKENLDNNLRIPQMYFEGWGEWFTAYWNQHMTTAWTDEIPPAEAVNRACDAADAVLANYPEAPWPYDYGFYPEVGY